MTEYYERVSTDGVWYNGDDRANEAAVADVLEGVWRMRLVRMPKFCAFDFYVERDDRVEAVVEVKARSCSSTTYPTSYLPLHKYTALTLTAAALGCAAVYAVKYADGVFWVPLEPGAGALGTKILTQRLPPTPQAVVEIPLERFNRASS